MLGSNRGQVGPITRPREGVPMVKQMLEYYIARFRVNEEGATAVEYGVLIALIIAVLVTIIATLGGTLLSAFTKVDTAIP
jgi:pilus assembly protein Flp/PilA